MKQIKQFFLEGESPTQIGLDFYYSFVKGNIIRSRLVNLVAVDSKGWILSVPTKVISIFYRVERIAEQNLFKQRYYRGFPGCVTEKNFSKLVQLEQVLCCSKNPSTHTPIKKPKKL